MKGHYKISDFAENIGKHTNTVDRWFNDMERRRIHYVNRSEDGVKIYDDLDLSIANFIRDRRDENWNLPAIYNKLEELFDLRPFPDDLTGVPQVADFEAFQRQFSDQIQQVIRQEVQKEVSEMRKQFEAALKSLPKAEDIVRALPKTSEDRQTRITEMITIERVKSQLRKEAFQLWQQKPESERMRKAGLFGLKKEEDHARRDQFVVNYIDEHFETRLKREYNL